MTTEELPAWAQPGSTAAIYSSQYGEKSVTLVTVERHTKTQIVIKDDPRRFYKDQSTLAAELPRFEMIGSRGPWASLCFLTDPESPRIKEMQFQTMVRNTATKVRDAAQDLLKKDALTSENVAKVAKLATRLQHFLEGSES